MAILIDETKRVLVPQLRDLGPRRSGADAPDA
jgi:hypothetical protein